MFEEDIEGPSYNVMSFVNLILTTTEKVLVMGEANADEKNDIMHACAFVAHRLNQKLVLAPDYREMN